MLENSYVLIYKQTEVGKRGPGRPPKKQLNDLAADKTTSSSAVPLKRGRGRPRKVMQLSLAYTFVNTIMFICCIRFRCLKRLLQTLTPST